MNQTHPTPEEIVDYLHGELPPTAAAAVAAHLPGCAECQEVRDNEVSLTELLRAHAKAEERELPPSVVAKIWEGVAPRKTSLWEQLGAAFRPALAVPVAIAIAAFLYFSFKTAHGPAHAATIDAGYYVNSYAALSVATPLSPDEPAPQTITSDVDAH
jgi:anti-sigma factor RsiW